MKFTNPEKLDFYVVLKRRIDEYFVSTSQSQYADWKMITKIILWLGTWLGSYLLILFGHLSVLQFFGVGLFHMFTHLMIAFNIAHDANHGSISKHPFWNNLLSHSLDLVGANALLWRINHNEVHHTFVNVDGMDNSIEGYKIFRFTNKDKREPIHRFQHLYATFFYGLSTLNYVLTKDFKLFKELPEKTRKRISSPKFWLGLVASKLFYVVYMLVIPILFTDIPWQYIVTVFVLGHFMIGLALAIVFQTGHLTEGTHYPDVNSEGDIEENWAIHILQTTGDYGVKNPLIQWLFGGINIHNVHHLFPKICHTHYYKLTDVIKLTAKEYGIPYREIPGFTEALISHYALLKKLGNSDCQDMKMA